MDTPWARAKLRQKNHESRFSRGPGASPQVNSGRLWWSKRDNKKFKFIVENRETAAGSYTVKVDELKKLTKDAFFHDSLPAMNIGFPNKQQDWMLIRTIDFEELYQRLLEYEAISEL